MRLKFMRSTPAISRSYSRANRLDGATPASRVMIHANSGVQGLRKCVYYVVMFVCVCEYVGEGKGEGGNIEY